MLVLTAQLPFSAKLSNDTPSPPPKKSSSLEQQLQSEGYLLKREDVAGLSPYLTSHIKRFGDYVLDFKAIPRSLNEQILVL